VLGVSATLCVLSSFEYPFPDGPSGCWGVFKADCYTITVGVERSVLPCAARIPDPLSEPSLGHRTREECQWLPCLRRTDLGRELS
jgi:hypothetical protein